MKVSTLPISAPEESIRERMESIENKRSVAEEQLFEQAKAEMEGLTQIVLNELEVRTSTQIPILVPSSSCCL